MERSHLRGYACRNLATHRQLLLTHSVKETATETNAAEKSYTYLPSGSQVSQTVKRFIEGTEAAVPEKRHARQQPRGCPFISNSPTVGKEAFSVQSMLDQGDHPGHEYGKTAKGDYKDLPLPTLTELQLRKLKREDLPHPSKLRKNSKRKLPKPTNSSVDISAHLLQLKRKQSSIRPNQGVSTAASSSRPSSSSSDSSRHDRKQSTVALDNSACMTYNRFSPTKIYDVKVTRERSGPRSAQGFKPASSHRDVQEHYLLCQSDESNSRVKAIDARTDAMYKNHIFDQASMWQRQSAQPDTPQEGCDFPRVHGYNSAQPYIEGAWDTRDVSHQDHHQTASALYRQPSIAVPRYSLPDQINSPQLSD